MANLEANIKGLDRLKLIWAMIIGRRIKIWFPDSAIREGLDRVNQSKGDLQ